MFSTVCDVNCVARAGQWDMTFDCRPEAALDRMKAAPADVVVSDMHMPGLNGLDMIQQMRVCAPESAYIMLTGTADLQVAVDAINQAEIFRFYTKPCAAEYLIEGIEAGLASRNEPLDGASQEHDLTVAAGLSALNQIAMGVIVVDRSAQVILTNQSAAAMLSMQDGLLLSSQGICRASAVAETEKLHELVRQTSANANAQDDPDVTRSIAISRPSMDRSFSVMALPVDDGTSKRQAVALFVTDPERFPLPSKRAIADLFGLTMAEAGIVCSLTKGVRLEDAAATQGITVSTARTYLKQAFAKTNTNRQSEIVKLVLTAAPLVSTSDS